MKFNRNTFWSEYRRLLGRVRPSQVKGLEQLLLLIEDDAAMEDLRFAAYALATVKHETGDRYEPIPEIGSERYFIRRYWEDARQRTSLENRTWQDAVKFAGRGYAQITGFRNYLLFAELLNLDLVNRPELALEPRIAYQILSLGMTRGLFTNRRLSQYFTEAGDDWTNARRIINGDVAKHGKRVGLYGRHFLAILQASQE